MKVCVPHLAYGALARSRWPRKARPRRRVILVVNAVSSRKISRSSRCRSHGISQRKQRRRRLATSARSSSWAARAFMGWPAPPNWQRKLSGAGGKEADMDIAVLGIDLGKNSCSVVGLDGSGRVVLRRRMHRDSVVKLVSGLPACIVAMEACCGAHHLGRLFDEMGHQVRLMSPEYVRPYVKAQKNDDRDAEAIAEAATRPTMRFVELKSAEQLDMQSLHRVRDRLVGERTALINQLRAVLFERGFSAPKGRRKLEQALTVLLDERGELPPSLALSPRVRWSRTCVRSGPSSTGASPR